MVRYRHKYMQVLVWSVCSFFFPLDFHPNQNVWAIFSNCIFSKRAFLTYCLWLYTADD
jgi:hypothetical protein